MLYWSLDLTSIMMPLHLIEEWQKQLANETDTRRYRLIMLTIAFLQGVQASRDAEPCGCEIYQTCEKCRAEKEKAYGKETSS